MKDILIMILASFGAIFILSSSIGLLRKPDVYLRISVTAKASTLGIGLMLTSAALYFNDYSVTTRIVAIILFVFLTISIGGHLLARAAYFTKTPIWKGTKVDDLAGQYDEVTHELYSEKHNSSIKPEKDTSI
ncbi:monovalent cation/H(+) antiporter subunit G [Aquiflexum gelatinilyticum]|jgi:multicomponent Na+:H+ antiporter subunit G|uniref:Monovalent cation/H(+) antiporter subunit G n=1 Tax=Aquiflexum gelatinilyticum TaxID=2961943 RepID=A0A9X2PAP0_9BACT|nr:monovalent cation/H(+) antiporter subunit G [Aquiflexum gelatinilyticum]MCR9017488.1 monovalent cation/H(+) antiporter subunit G [Aquiflexum gelatinilyticum]MCS4434648.1 monovalent cation/H(+) antiporter subunit G [Aquiflexum gelatinilyticum]